MISGGHPKHDSQGTLTWFTFIIITFLSWHKRSIKRPSPKHSEMSCLCFTLTSSRENNFQTEFTILVHCGFCSIGFLMVFVVSGMKMISGGHPKHDSQGTLTWLCIHLHHHHLFISARENHRKTISFGLAYPKNVNKTTPKTSVAKKWLTDNKAWWTNRLLHYSFPALMMFSC